MAYDTKPNIVIRNRMQIQDASCWSLTIVKVQSDVFEVKFDDSTYLYPNDHVEMIMKVLWNDYLRHYGTLWDEHMIITSNLVPGTIDVKGREAINKIGGLLSMFKNVSKLTSPVRVEAGYCHV